ncbi:putative short transient receptor potential channel 2-like protein isoform X2 [Sceloporus undulatus]|uniref:putative short transient receptor potential channel 2-like protein isoform X2 n=1 Tax=Sceloporus undulatus TaxID=8520 RepID=UPI001C4CEBA4|nr:putative short transient receptor potential channel 2-like protein isoform X2 [Sceloporus undulatus]
MGKSHKSQWRFCKGLKMAPVKIKHVVSFTSQDPKYPVENLLLQEGPRPWLCAPRDRSRQLRAELQLEQASHIGYVDVGNCGSAFLQIDVGRSSWPLDQSYLTLLPTAALMVPGDAKLDKNRSGVRMFKEGDFLASALAEKWDRIRLTCSQPFNRRAQFGLAFIQIRTPQDTEEGKEAPASSPSETPSELPSNPWLSNAAICRTFFPEEPTSTEEEVALKSRLVQLDPSSLSGASTSVCLSRSARMVLTAASARKRTFPLAPDSSPLQAKGREDAQSQQVAQDPQQLGSKQEPSGRRDRRKASRRRGPCNNARRPRDVSQRKGRAQEHKRNVEREEKEEVEERKERANWLEDGGVGLGTCPICAVSSQAKDLR